MLETVAAFVASAVGKTATGTALAALSLGGMHAAGVVDLPGLPDDAEADEILASQDESGDVDDDNVVVIEVPSDEESDEDETDGDETDGEESDGEESDESDDDGDETDGDEAGGPSEHALAMQEWASCVGEAASQRGVEMPQRDASVDGPPGRFDPEEACGDKPVNPNADKGDDDAPDEDAPDDEGDDGDETQIAPQQGPPQDRPTGPPADRGQGRPEGAGNGGGGGRGRP